MRIEEKNQKPQKEEAHKDYYTHEQKKASFKEINEKFKQYWKTLLWLIIAYIGSYLTWNRVFSPKIRNLLVRKGWDETSKIIVIVLAIIRGFIFSLDGFVTSLLKTPFQQMCYAINITKEISHKDKDYMILRATESSELCKEDLKKFGLLNMVEELMNVFISKRRERNGQSSDGPHAYLLNISYLIPLIFSAASLLLIYWRLRKIRKIINDNQEKAEEELQLHKNLSKH